MICFSFLLLTIYVACGAANATLLPQITSDSNDQNAVLDGGGFQTVWEANYEPLFADPAVSSIIIRRATLRRVALRAPEPSAPVVLASLGGFTGLWHLENLIIYTQSCEELQPFAELACDLQPATWISSRGWAVTISSFAPQPATNGTTSLTNVTIACDASDSTAPSPSPATGLTAACVTATAATADELLSLLTYDPDRYGSPLPPLTSRLHITLMSNISLDVPTWTAVHPVVRRPKTTLSGDCLPGHVTSLNLAGGTSLMGVAAGGVLRMLCLELANLATDTLRNMPRGLLSGAVWAVDVDIPSGARLWVDNSTLILTKDEFVWQSYYMAQVLANTAVGSSVVSVLRVFEGSMTSSNLQWQQVVSPHTLWRNCILTTSPTVFETTVPNSFIMKYLGHSMYLTDLRMVDTCEQFRTAVQNLTAVNIPSPLMPYAVVMGSNISIGSCWPAEGVPIASQSLAIMGLPDRTTVLDLSGRYDAFVVSRGASLSLRYLTLTGLSTHGLSSDPNDDSFQVEASISASSGAASGSGTSSGAAGIAQRVNLMTSLLWAFKYSRFGLQLQLDNVNIVMPYVELQQYDKIVRGRTDVMPYFLTPLMSFLQASSLDHITYLSHSSFANPTPADTSSNASDATAPNASSSLVATPLPPLFPLLPFRVLVLPGIRGLEVNLTSWPTEYASWNASMYGKSATDGGGGAGTDTGGGGGGGGGGGSGNSKWAAWRVAVLAAGVGLAVVTVMAAALVYGRHRAIGAAAATAGAASPPMSKSKSRRRGDVEAGFNVGVGGVGGGRDGGSAAGAAAGAGGARGGGNACGGEVQLRRPLYDSFDDPVFELDLVKGAKLSPDDVADILDRVNAEAAEFNITMTEICGSGSFGVVYGGMWHGLKVAIKTMVFSESAPSLVAGQVARQQCIREAAFCCTMHHPNVVATYHFYLKSAKRSTMFDDLLQQLETASSGEDHKPLIQYRHRKAQPSGKRQDNGDGNDNGNGEGNGNGNGKDNACGDNGNNSADGGDGDEERNAQKAPAVAFLAAGPVAEATAESAVTAMAAAAAEAEGPRVQFQALEEGKSKDGPGDKDQDHDREREQEEEAERGRGRAAAAAGEAVGGGGDGAGAEPAGVGKGGSGDKAARRRIRGPPGGPMPVIRPHDLARQNTAVTDWRLYLIQEYCDGGTLRQAVDGKVIFRHGAAERAAAGDGGAAVAPACPTGAGAAELGPVAIVAVETAAGDNGGGGGAGEGRLTNGHSDRLSDCLLPELENWIAEAHASTAASVGACADGAGGGEGNLGVGGSGGAAVSPAAAAAMAGAEAGAAAAAAWPPSAAVQRLRAVLTMDSNGLGTTATNATGESMMLGTAASNCSDSDEHNGGGGGATAAAPVCQHGPPPASRPLDVLPAIVPFPSAAPAVLPRVPVRATPVGAAAVQHTLQPASALPADLAVVIHTALGIASGVAYLHSRSIIHGDLSANNVLLVKTSVPGIPVVAKLSDFGLSMRLEQGQDHLKNVHHGTPYYQSPEVYEHGTCSLAADVYSLGVLLWELYHGPPPWRAKKHKAHKPPKINSALLRAINPPGVSSDTPKSPPPAPGASAGAGAASKDGAAMNPPQAPADAAADADLWDDQYYQLRACDVLQIAPHCPPRYARLLRCCLSPDPAGRPSARSVVKALLSMERGIAAAAAAAEGGSSTVAGAPVGALMALTRPHLAIIPGRTHDAALLLEDFDAAAAAVAAAVARVTAEPTVAGAPATAGAAAAAAKAAKAGNASSGLLAVIGPHCGTPAASSTANAVAVQHSSVGADGGGDDRGGGGECDRGKGSEAASPSEAESRAVRASSGAGAPSTTTTRMGVSRRQSTADVMTLE